MKILVMSDTHHSLEYAKIVLDKLKTTIQMVMHLGDHDEDAEELQNLYPELLIHSVAGNCDVGSMTPKDRTIDLAGKKIWMTHGHRHQVKWGYDPISYAAEEQGADIVLFGHTHEPLITYRGKIVLINPGSLSQPRTTRYPTYGILELSETKDMQASIVEANKKEGFKIIRNFLYTENQ